MTRNKKKDYVDFVLILRKMFISFLIIKLQLYIFVGNVAPRGLRNHINAELNYMTFSCSGYRVPKKGQFGYENVVVNDFYE